MKAWIVTVPESWTTLMHAETAGKAKVAAMRNVADEEGDYLVFAARRLKGCDDKPITYQNAKDAGFEYLNEDYWDGELQGASEFINDCPCEICRQK